MSKVKYIGVFGKRNTGKSSLINTITGQDVAIVSDIPGTTTDPVRKRMEIFGIGPVVIIDTAGIDDSGELGDQRVKRSKQIINQIDIAILLFTNNQLDRYEKELIRQFKEEDIPLILVHNQSDIIPLDSKLALEITEKYGIDVVEFSCNMLGEDRQKEAVEMLTSLIVKGLQTSFNSGLGLFEGLMQTNDLVLLVCPVDSEAPEGRLILPQVNAIRDILDRGGVSVVLQPEALGQYLSKCSTKPKLVVTDSQAFDKVSKIVPNDIPLTGFSPLLARSKGFFEHYLNGTPKIDNLKDGDRVLILESCSHHSSCEDIGRVKIPMLLQKKTGKKLEWDVVAGLDEIPRKIKDYSIVIQCGGCMITNRQLFSRLKPALTAGLPVTNYGMTLAYCMGIYSRAIKPLINRSVTL
ncbi:MAG: [FeFe] hydrogenase H-cluster maturation GTPase HydF [Bacteroidales bacterium]